jgi:hypothetical protein
LFEMPLEVSRARDVRDQGDDPAVVPSS